MSAASRLICSSSYLVSLVRSSSLSLPTLLPYNARKSALDHDMLPFTVSFQSSLNSCRMSPNTVRLILFRCAQPGAKEVDREKG
ncbi:hypothetical protein D3C80_1730140 [compost metagenome]